MKTFLDPIKNIEKLIRKYHIKRFKFRACDLSGRQIEFTVPTDRFVNKGILSSRIIDEGIAVDASSIRGFKTIEQSDMLLIPDLKSVVYDVDSKTPTLIFVCDFKEPENHTTYWRDPRGVALRAEEYLVKTGIADVALFGPELEFFLFNSVSWKIREGYHFLNIVSKEGGIGEYDDIGDTYKIRKQEGYFSLPPYDSFTNVREEMCTKLHDSSITVERDTHERATAGSAEIDIKYDTLTTMADKILLLKNIVKSTAKKYDLMATFMPKPLFGHNGNGMHIHHSLRKDDRPIFYDSKGKYYHLSKLALYYIGGMLTHAKALTAITSPTINSYKRLLPGFEAPTTIAFGYKNRSTCIRIPAYPLDPGSKRIELRMPDPSTNPYLCFSAMLMAGIDGIMKKIDPIKMGFGPLETNGYELDESKTKRRFTFISSSLEEALYELEKDNVFLLEGGVFTKEYIKMWVEFKRKEIQEVFKHPTPVEFEHYFDV